MPKKMKTRRLTHGNSKTKAMVVVAHPDDESLFMLGPILKQVVHQPSKKIGRAPTEKSCEDWTIVCVTDGNGAGEGIERLKLFRGACRDLGVKAICLEHPDLFGQGIHIQKLAQQLKAMGENWSAIYTHGPLGEYGHPHHQGVCLAVHSVYQGQCPIWSVSNNVFSELTVLLNPAEFRKKSKILIKYYLGEIRKLLNLIPVHSHESYNHLSLKQVVAIQDAIQGKDVAPKLLGPYAWLHPLLKEGDWKSVAAKFFKVYFVEPKN